MWYIIAVTVPLVLLYRRRFKRPLYSTQKFSRSNEYFQKRHLAPLKAPWNVRIQDYNPIQTERLPIQAWWFRCCNTDGKARMLFEVSPYSFTKVPYNPLGRTGAEGRGVLKYWGANYIKVVVSLNKNNHIGRVEMGKNITVDNTCEIIHRGYIDHPANTDNAWIEGDVFVNKEITLFDDLRDEYTWLQPFLKYSTPVSSPD